MGFGLVLVVLGIVAVWSIVGFNGVVGNLDTAVACSGVQNEILEGELAHLNWANKVSALLTDEHVTKLNVQTDPTKCAFGQWYHGEGRKQAEQLVPESRKALAAVGDVHRRLHESAIEIGKHFVQADPELPTLLAVRIGDHLAWASTVRDAFLEQRDSLNVQTDPKKCGLGKWLHTDQAKTAYKNGNRDFQQAWDQMVETHGRLHESAHKIEGYLAFERVATARKAKEDVSHELGRIAEHLSRTLEKGMEEVIDPAKEKAEADQDIEAMADWGEIDMVMNEGIIQPFMVARIHMQEVATEGYTPERWAEYEEHAKEFDDGIDHWFTLVKGSESLEGTVNELRNLSARWAGQTQKYHQAVQDEQGAVASLDSARTVLREETLPILRETLTHLGELRAEAEHELNGMKKANTVYATVTKPALEEVGHLLSEVEEHTHQASQAENQAIQTRATSTRFAVAVVGTIALVVGVLLAFFIARSIIKVLTRPVAGLNEGADQVNDAAGQVSSASQSLAEGASEQASSLEETSSALEEMAAMTRTNAENAKEANNLSEQARDAAQSGDKTMEQLNSAMTAINDSSGQISKIIKVIEEIAFQTNLLALNAAVEAARAGEHGKGFAVVADEVRNLAQRAAQAARETTGLIEDSVNRAKEGTDVAGEVGKALGAIVGDVTKVTDLVDGIAKASEEQAQGVDQVNTAVSQMDRVTQQNASGAEESASAAEELSAQASTVKGMVEELSGLVGGKARGSGSTTAPATGQTYAASRAKKPLHADVAHWSTAPPPAPVGAGARGHAEQSPSRKNGSSNEDMAPGDKGLGEF